jgi:hypothetical protein
VFFVLVLGVIDDADESAVLVHPRHLARDIVAERCPARSQAENDARSWPSPSRLISQLNLAQSPASSWRACCRSPARHRLCVVDRLLRLRRASCNSGQQYGTGRGQDQAAQASSPFSFSPPCFSALSDGSRGGDSTVRPT